MSVYGNILESVKVLSKNNQGTLLELTYRGKNILLTNSDIESCESTLKSAIFVLIKNSNSITKEAKESFYSLAERRGYFEESLENEKKLEERRHNRGVYSYRRSIREKFTVTLSGSYIETTISGNNVTFKILYKSRLCEDHEFTQSISINNETKSIKFGASLD